ncbi:hypothetical protein NOCARDAX2BIS_720004 [Nocardioides sp. AX2bis]|nr:hypothetical protein NOCARDAX2BIS_720004 [Nocardioides sp. AX2bis]
MVESVYRQHEDLPSVVVDPHLSSARRLRGHLLASCGRAATERWVAAHPT